MAGRSVSVSFTVGLSQVSRERRQKKPRSRGDRRATRLCVALRVAAVSSSSPRRRRSRARSGSSSPRTRTTASRGRTFAAATTSTRTSVNAAMVDAHQPRRAARLRRRGRRHRQPRGGDRARAPIQSAAASWAQFQADYIDGLTATTTAGTQGAALHRARATTTSRTRRLLQADEAARRQDGAGRDLQPDDDAAAAEDDGDLRLRAATACSTRTRSAACISSSSRSGPTRSSAPGWRTTSQHVDRSTPVVIFTHDQPEAQAKHFTNPNGAPRHQRHRPVREPARRPAGRRPTIDAPTVVEQRELERFLERHRNITAYFHGNSNWNEFYDWTGPAPHASRCTRSASTRR